MKYLGLTFLLCSNFAFAGNFHYCTGLVTDLVTWGTSEGTSVRIEGLNGYAKLNFGGDAQSAMQDRQFSMLLSAYMANKEVILEFVDSTLTCNDSHNGASIRNVKLSQ